MPRLIWLYIGHFFVGLGILGIFLPILPTTPFILLASACYSRGSERFNLWLLNHPVFGPALRDWRAQKIIRIKAKIVASISIFVAIGVVVLAEKIPIYGKVGMVSVVLPVWLYLVTRPSRPRDKDHISENCRL
jgi:uncharacterized membrane protein YbaN (DUF454 family)